MLVAPYVRFHILVKTGYYTEWPPIGKIAACSAHDKVPECYFSFSNLSFWSGNFFLIVPFPDYSLL